MKGYGNHYYIAVGHGGWAVGKTAANAARRAHRNSWTAAGRARTYYVWEITEKDEDANWRISGLDGSLSWDEGIQVNRVGVHRASGKLVEDAWNRGEEAAK